MRTSCGQHPRRRTRAIAFVVTLVAGFFALAPSASACQNRIEITKIETGAAAPGATYDIVVTDTASGEVAAVVAVAAGSTSVVSDVPTGTYSLTEVGAPSGATIVPDVVAFGPSKVDQTVHVVVTNPYEAGRLAIEKVQTGESAPGGTFTFDIAGDGVDLVAVVAAGATWTSDWLPFGTYTITERDAPAGATIEPNPVVLDTDGATVTVTATNPYRDFRGRLAITKVVTGGGDPAGPFTLDVTGPQDLTVTVAAGETWTSGWLPLGTYTIAERDAPAGATIEPNPVLLDTDGATVAVIVTNPSAEQQPPPAGRLAIRKVELGDPAVPGTFTFDVAGPVSFAVDVRGGETWTSGWLPLGTYTVTERDAPVGVTVAPNPAILADDLTTVTVTVTNPAVLSGGGGGGGGGGDVLPPTGGGAGTATIATLLVAAGLGVRRGSRVRRQDPATA